MSWHRSRPWMTCTGFSTAGSRPSRARAEPTGWGGGCGRRASSWGRRTTPSLTTGLIPEVLTPQLPAEGDQRRGIEVVKLRSEYSPGTIGLVRKVVQSEVVQADHLIESPCLAWEMRAV